MVAGGCKQRRARQAAETDAAAGADAAPVPAQIEVQGTRLANGTHASPAALAAVEQALRELLARHPEWRAPADAAPALLRGVIEVNQERPLGAGTEVRVLVVVEVEMGGRMPARISTLSKQDVGTAPSSVELDQAHTHLAGAAAGAAEGQLGLLFAPPPR